MPDFRSLNTAKNRIPSISIDNYTFSHDKKSAGFKAVLNWSCENPNIRMFKIYKSVIGADLLKKDYSVDELTMSRLTEKRSFPLDNKILYDKNFFTKNKSVNLKTSSESYSQVYKDSSTSVFFEVGFVRADNSRRYSFVDRNVKFGESYYYQITGITNDLRETPKTKPVLVSAELPSNPPPPDVVQMKITAEGILMTMGNSKSGSTIRGYEVYRLNKKTKKYEFIFFVEKKEICDFVSFIDSPDQLGEMEHYKIFSVDIFNAKSISARKERIIFDTIFEKKRKSENPKFVITKDKNFVVLKIYNTGSRFFRVERRDVWKNETGFSLKSKNGIFWNSTNYIGKNDEFVEFFDYSAMSGKDYQYKISNLEDLGDVGGFVITPTITIEEGLNYSSFDEDREAEDEEVVLEGLRVSVRDKKRSPCLLSVKWNYSGGESNFFKLVFTSGQDNEIEIDSSLSEVLLELEKGKEYSFDFKVCSDDGKVLMNKKGNSVKT